MDGRSQNALFDDRFLESYAGQAIMNDSRVALIELIANAWDANATKVEIALPQEHGDRFSILDNGHGMNESQFRKRFMKFGYRRLEDQGKYAESVPEAKNVSNRPAFGKNAKGKFATFLFGKKFRVRTWRDDIEHNFEVWPSNKSGLAYKKVSEDAVSGHGTEIYVDKAKAPNLSEDEARSEIGMRFLTDPFFEVFVNGHRVDFSDIPADSISSHIIQHDELGSIKITIIDTNITDKSTHQHGVAWWVEGRLVGECTWKGTGQEHLFDGRRTPARRYTFIVQADGLNEVGIVLPDWSGFNPKHEKYLLAKELVNNYVRSYVLKLSEETREETFKEIKVDNADLLKKMPLAGRGKWEDFIREVQKECQSITEDDLGRLSTILAKLETTDSKYGLIYQLSAMDADNLEELNSLLNKWDIDLAKIVLDELEGRLRLLEQLKLKVNNKETHEVLELQPLFHRGLWIFGPEYETIEYTSNEGMTSVIQNLFGGESVGSRNRPDFVVLPDSTVGLYSFPKFDDDDKEEIGPDRLTIVELKKPGIEIGKEEKDQPLKYTEELSRLGFIKDFTKITCFVLGDSLNTYFGKPATELDGSVRIIPMTYDTVINRAKSRSLKLYDKVRSAPFLQETRLEEFLLEKAQTDLFTTI